MALKITDNFDHTSDQPNFKRDQFTTIAEMKACTVCDDGHLSYCKEDGKRYEFKSTNTFSDTTGYWAEFQAGGGGASDADEVTYDSTKETHTAGSVGAELMQLALEIGKKTEYLGDIKDAAEEAEAYCKDVKETIDALDAGTTTEAQQIAANKASIAQAPKVKAVSNIGSFDIADENGNVLMRIVKGSIITKGNLCDDSVVINDALNQTSASAVMIAYDKYYGLCGAAYMAGANGTYGEAGGWIQLAVFPASQPTNIKWIDIAKGNSEYEHNVISLGKGVFRVFYIQKSASASYKYKDYNFNTDTLSEEQTVMFNNGTDTVELNLANVSSYLNGLGYTSLATSYPLIMTSSIKSYNSKLWGVLTCISTFYPVVFSSEDNMATLTPYSVIPEVCNCECQIEWFNDVLHALVRTSSNIKYTYLVDDAWNAVETITDATWSKPSLVKCGDYLVAGLTYVGSDEDSSFPTMLTGWKRKGFKLFITDTEKTAFADWTNRLDYNSKYGFVYYDMFAVYDDLYIGYSDSQLGTMVSSGNSTQEQCKECVKFQKLRY